LIISSTVESPLTVNLRVL